MLRAFRPTLVVALFQVLHMNETNIQLASCTLRPIVVSVLNVEFSDAVQYGSRITRRTSKIKTVAHFRNIWFLQGSLGGVHDKSRLLHVAAPSHRSVNHSGDTTLTCSLVVESKDQNAKQICDN